MMASLASMFSAALLIGLAVPDRASATDPPAWVDVRAYGAKGDGGATGGNSNDTRPLNDAMAALLSAGGGTLLLPPGVYSVNATLRWFQTGSQARIRVVGASRDTTTLRWDGPENGTAVRVQRAVGFEIAHLTIKNNVGRGSTTGLLVLSEVIGGSDTGPGVLTNVTVDGFQDCYVVGQGQAPSGHAASELWSVNLMVKNCRTGVTINHGQSPDHWFHGLGMTSNGTGLLTQNQGGGSTLVYGGSASNNLEDFALRGSGPVTIDGFRSENAGRFLTIGSEAGADGPTTGSYIRARRQRQRHAQR